MSIDLEEEIKEFKEGGSRKKRVIDTGVHYETVIVEEECENIQKQVKGNYYSLKLNPLMNFRMYGVIF